MASMFRLIKDGDLAGVQRAVQESAAKLDARVTSGGDTPLTFALDPRSGSHPDIAQWLIERGAALDLQDNAGWTALMTACRYDHADVAISLIEKGANVNVKTSQGWTALMYACRHDQPDTVKMLIEHGAKLDEQNFNGWTALILACNLPAAPHHTFAGLLRSVKLCYAAGADVDLKLVDGKDALAVATALRRADAVTFLEFATTSEVAQILLGELKQPRGVVVAFYDAELLTLEACSDLKYADVEELGVAPSQQRRAVLQRFNPGAELPRQSLPRRASQRIVSALRRL